MRRAVLPISSLLAAICFIACGGGGTVPTPPKNDRDVGNERREATALAAGDRVEVTAPTEYVTCGIDLAAFREYQQVSIEYDTDPKYVKDVDASSPPIDRQLAQLFKDRRIVRIKTGSVGVATGESGTERVDRTAMKYDPIDAAWAVVRFDDATVYAPKMVLDKTAAAATGKSNAAGGAGILPSVKK
jgi:hypothetical protein